MSGSTFTIEQLARAVAGSDAYNFALSAHGVSQILDIALRSRVGMNCVGLGAPIRIDLGNGHHLVCTVEPARAAP